MSWLDTPPYAADTYLPDVVQLLWPPPARLSTNRRSPHPGQVRRYLIVPSARRPKVLIPAASRRVSAAAIRGFKSTQSARDRVVLAALAAALRLGAGFLLPDRLLVADAAARPRTDLEAHLCLILQRTVHLSLHVSAPRAVRKPVLQVIDDAGRTFAFAKLGIDEFTSQLVRAESRSVQRLSRATWRHLCVPAVLHAGTWDGHELLVQGAFERADGYETAGPALAAAMDELARVDGASSAPLTTSPFWTRLTRRVERLPVSEHRELLQSSMSELQSRAGVTPLEFGSWHGDWTPWNMNVAGGRVRVWDWEKYEQNVPIGFDAAHFYVQRGVVDEQRGPVDVFAELLERAGAVLAPHRISAPRLVAWLYILNIAVTYLEDGELEAGSTAATRLGDWLAPTLRRAATC